MSTHTTSHPTASTDPTRWTARALWRWTLDRSLLLPIGGLVALVWANLASESYFIFARRFAFGVNNIGMALFFGLLAQEVVEELMPGGALQTWRRWGPSIVAAAGAAAGAAAVYLLVIELKQEAVLAPGWLVACAFDIAFGYFVVKSVFRGRSAMAFFLLMAIATSMVGLAVVAFRYQAVDTRPGGTALMLVALGLAYVMRRVGVRRFWLYLLVCGPPAWWAFYWDGLHPALALVPLVPFLPHRPRAADEFVDAPDDGPASPRRYEHEWHDVVQVVLLLFGLVNTGVLLQGYGTGTWALLAAALVGRPMGMLAALRAAVALGMRLPPRLRWPDLTVIAQASSSGFAFAMFFATAVYPAGPILGEIKIGAVLTGVGVVVAFAVARALRVGRFARS